MYLNPSYIGSHSYLRFYGFKPDFSRRIQPLPINSMLSFGIHRLKIVNQLFAQANQRRRFSQAGIEMTKGLLRGFQVFVIVFQLPLNPDFLDEIKISDLFKSSYVVLVDELLRGMNMRNFNTGLT